MRGFLFSFAYLICVVTTGGVAVGKEHQRCDATLPSASIPLSGGETFLLAAPEAGKAAASFDIYLQAEANPHPLAPICVARVSLNGQERPELTGSISLKASDDPAGLLRITVSPKDQDFRSQGQWKITG